MGIIDSAGEKNRTLGRPVPYKSQFGQFTSKYDIPEGAVLLTKQEMQELLFRTITKWEPKSDMWAFRNGIGILGATSVVSGIYLNAEMRSKFKLGNINNLVTFAPTCIIPCVTAIMVQYALIQTKVMLRESHCPTCTQIQSGSLLVANGVLQPAVLALLSCSIVARYNHTIKLPPITSRELWLVYAKMLRPLKTPLLVLTLLNFGVGVFMTEQHMKAIDKVHDKLSRGM